MILLLRLLNACAPNEPDSVHSQSWGMIQELGAAVEVPQDSALQLEYSFTDGVSVFDVDGDGPQITIGQPLAEERHARLNQP